MSNLFQERIEKDMLSTNCHTTEGVGIGLVALYVGVIAVVAAATGCPGGGCTTDSSESVEP